MKRTPRAVLAFVMVAILAVTFVASAQLKKTTPVLPLAKKPTSNTVTTARAPLSDGGVPKKTDSLPVAAADAGAPGSAATTRMLDGGTRVFRFGEVEVEGRLKSPQIVYFLRRVRAEFSATDLGHRSFLGELSETRNESGL